MGNWRDQCRGKLMTADEAVKRVQPGDTVAVAPFTCTPHTLCRALLARVRSGGLRGIRVDHPASLAPWCEPDVLGAIELHDNYATPFNRAAVRAGTVEYLPIGLWRTDTVPDGFTARPNVFLVPVSPPDRTLSPPPSVAGRAARHRRVRGARCAPCMPAMDRPSNSGTQYLFRSA